MRMQSSSAPRRGAMAPLGAVLCVVVLGMVAFGVDVAWMVLARTELQNAADAAALAGTGPLGDSYVTYLLTQDSARKERVLANALTAARAKARECAGYNAAGGVPSLTLNDDDIEFGFTDGRGTYQAVPGYTGYPNTIKVRMRRDTRANGSLKLFFGPVLGRSTNDLAATASASPYTGTVNGLAPGMAVLPMTYDVEHWDNFLKTGQDPDGSLSFAIDGTHQLQIYPSVKHKGNFGLLSLDDEHASAREVERWIKNGVTAEDIQALTRSALIPLASHDPEKWDWLGTTGLKASNIMDVNAHTGKTFLMPLFKAKNSDPKDYAAGVGQGSSYSYNIVRFVAVKIMPTPDTNREVVVQPARTMQTPSVFDTATFQPLGTTTQPETVMAPGKLIR